MSQFLAILFSATTAMVKLQLVIGCGVLLGLLDIVPPVAVKSINRMLFVLFVPCLLFSKIAPAMSLEALTSLFIVAVYAILNIAFGFFLGYIGWLLIQFYHKIRSKKDQIIILSEDEQFSLTEEEIVKDITNEDSDKETSKKQRMVAAVAFGNATSLPLGLIGGIYPSDYQTELNLALSYIAVYMSISQVLMYSIGYAYLAKGNETSTWKESILRTLEKFLTPPTFALVVGCIVGIIPQVQRLFYYNGNDVPIFPQYPSVSPPFLFLANGIESLADVAVPMMLVILGVNLSKGPGGGVDISEIVMTAIMKLIVSPIVGIISVGILNYYGLLANDVMYLVLLIMTATPSAITLVLLTSILGKGETEMSAVLFYQYIFSMITLTIALMTFFVIIDMN